MAIICETVCFRKWNHEAKAMGILCPLSEWGPIQTIFSYMSLDICICFVIAMTMSTRQDNNEKHRVRYSIQPEPRRNRYGRKHDYKGRRLNRLPSKYVFPFCAFWTSYLYVELFPLSYASVQWLYQQYFFLLVGTFVLYHIQTVTSYQGNHNGSVMWPIIQ